MLQRALICCCLTLAVACASSKTEQRSTAGKTQLLKNTFGTYGAPPRLGSGRVNMEKLLAELKELNATTYHWLIWQNKNDWDDLQIFLPLARKANIKVWVTVVPPTESKPVAKFSSEPYQMDYRKWAEAFARLSLEQPNLTAWSIDDFAHNLKTFTPSYTDSCLQAAKAVNPRLSFVPCVYYRQITPQFAADYGRLLDGLLFPYRAESAGANLKDPSMVESEIAAIRKLFKPGMPVFVDIYATAHSRLGASTPGYVRQVLEYGKRYADGVLIYCHQDPVRSAAKYNIIKEGFARR